jgi:iron complex transport system substrate-binding protein
MRIVSLLPAGTEMVAALGAEGRLVGISHACDWPASVQHLPRVTTTPIDTRQTSGSTDAQVAAIRAGGRPVIAVDSGLLRELAPDLILTQELCDVCAVVEGDLHPLAVALDPVPVLLSLSGRTLEGILADIVSVGAALDLADEAEELNSGLRYRLRTLAGLPREPQPRVVCLEWLDPLYLAGHWVPDLIRAAGGLDVGAEPGFHSRTMSVPEAQGLKPDLVLVALCGFGVDRAAAEYLAFEERQFKAGGRAAASWRCPVWLLDGNSYTSRPGPRVVDGAVRIAAALRGEAMAGLRRIG